MQDLTPTHGPSTFVVEELRDLVEEAVYQEFERVSERGGDEEDDVHQP